MDISQNDSHRFEHEDDDFEDYDPQITPNAVHELHRDYGNLNEIDLSSVGVNNVFTHDNFNIEVCDNETSDDDEEDTLIIPEGEQSRVVSELPLDFFRSKLVEHFNMLFEQKKLVWPNSSRTQQSL